MSASNWTERGECPTTDQRPDLCVVIETRGGERDPSAP